MDHQIIYPSSQLHADKYFWKKLLGVQCLQQGCGQLLRQCLPLIDSNKQPDVVHERPLHPPAQINQDDSIALSIPIHDAHTCMHTHIHTCSEILWCLVVAVHQEGTRSALHCIPLGCVLLFSLSLAAIVHTFEWEEQSISPLMN